MNHSNLFWSSDDITILAIRREILNLVGWDPTLGGNTDEGWTLDLNLPYQDTALEKSEILFLTKDKKDPHNEEQTKERFVKTSYNLSKINMDIYGPFKNTLLNTPYLHYLCDDPNSGLAMVGISSSPWTGDHPIA